MSFITIHAHNKSENGTHSREFNVSNKSKEILKKEIDDFFASVPFDRWYYSVSSLDKLTESEEQILTELDCEVD